MNVFDKFISVAIVIGDVDGEITDGRLQDEVLHRCFVGDATIDAGQMLGFDNKI